MQIIVLHSRLANSRSITLTIRHLVLAIVLFVVMVLAAAFGLYYATVQYGPATKLPMFDHIASAISTESADKQDRYIRENLSAMAVKMGEMEARLMRLDALGERVQGLSGVQPEEFSFRELPGRGGPAPTLLALDAAPELEITRFGNLLEGLARDIESRDDYMNVVETALMRDRIQSKMLPTIQPVDVAYNSSSFGVRHDPFNGRSSFHEGIDFAAPTGTPIVAAAAGVVIAAEYHYQYGNMIEIDHGNDIVTRYAHASRLHVKLGDIVKRSQHIADIGSTGRSTGPHLHFEVRVKGVAQDPQKFLNAGAEQRQKKKVAAR